MQYEGQTVGLTANRTDPALNQQVTAHRLVGESGSHCMNSLEAVEDTRQSYWIRVSSISFFLLILFILYCTLSQSYSYSPTL